MKTYAQGSLVTPRAPMRFKAGDSGRLVSAHPGQTLWVWTTEAAQKLKGSVQFARSGKPGPSGWLFSLADAEKYFVPVGEERSEKGSAIETSMAVNHSNCI